MAIWADVVKGLTGPVADYFKTRTETKSRERTQKAELADAVHKRQVDLISQGLAADATWEIESIKAHSGGWKDEAVLIMFMIPYVLCFVPSTVKYVHEGFNALSETPAWYQVASVSVFLAVYGIRWFRRMQSDT